MDEELLGITNERERSEKGQESMLAASVLPIEMQYGSKAILKRHGVFFKGYQDFLFYSVELPLGWSLVKAPNKPPYWNWLLDANKKVVAQVFYRVNFYSRQAWLHLEEEWVAQNAMQTTEEVHHG